MIQAVCTDAAPVPAPGAPYSQAIRAGDLVFTCGQLPIDPKTGRVVDGGIAEQVEQALANLAAVLDAAGSSMNQLVKVTVLLRHREHWSTMNEIYARHVGHPPPARTSITASDMAPGALVEFDAVANVTVPADPDPACGEP